MDYSVLALTLDVSTPLLVLGAVCLAVAVAFASRSADQEDVYSKHFNHKGRGLEAYRKKHAPPTIIRRHVVLLPDGTKQDAAEYAEGVAKRSAQAKKAELARQRASKLYDDAMSPQQQVLALDLAWLEEQYTRDPTLESIDARRARKIVWQLADAEPDRMVLLLRRWLREEHLER